MVLKHHGLPIAGRLKMKKSLVMACCFILWLASAGSALAASGDLEKGFEAHDKGYYKTAYSLILPFAKNGDKEAQAYIGLMHYYGQGRPPVNYEEAFHWFEKSADQGFSGSQYFLAAMYQKGQHVAQNYEKAFEYYKLAANQGDVYALYELGLMYDVGQFVEQNDEKAFEYYKMAADQGYAAAQNNLGVMYGEGRFVDQSDEKAFEYFKSAADQGDVDAKFNLAIMYEDGRGVDADKNQANAYYEEVFKLSKDAAKQGDLRAQFLLAGMCQYGKGAAKDYQKAFDWYQRAFSQGNAPAAGLRNFANLLVLMGQTRQAIDEYEKAIQIDGDSWRAYSHKGLARLELGETEKAFENIWIGLQKSNFEASFAWLAKAIYHWETDDLDKAAQAIAKACELDVKDMDNQLVGGYILCKKGDVKGALQYFDHVLEKEAGHPLALSGVGLAYFKEGKLDEAKNMFQKAAQNKDKLEEATQYCTPFMLRIFSPALSAASPMGIKPFKLGLNQTEYQNSWGLRYFKKPTAIKYEKSTRFVPPDEPLIVDLENDVIIKPYPGVKVKPDELAEGRRFKIVGTCERENDYYQIKMDILADATIDHLLIFGNPIPPDAAEWIEKPKFQKRFSFGFEIPVSMASESFSIVIMTEEKKSHKFDIQIQGSKIIAKQSGKEFDG